MKPLAYPAPIHDLVAQLKRMPGIGPRSAERIALWMLTARNAQPGDIADTIRNVTSRVKPCVQCGFFTDTELCEICSDESRGHASICVVEQPTDIILLERTGALRGRYHALGGRISPLNHVGPEELRIGELIERVKTQQPTEVILALAADVEGEATALYLADLLKSSPVTVTRIAQGLPAGTSVESADEVTLSRALKGRFKMGV